MSKARGLPFAVSIHYLPKCSDVPFVGDELAQTNVACRLLSLKPGPSARPGQSVCQTVGC